MYLLSGPAFMPAVLSLENGVGVNFQFAELFQTIIGTLTYTAPRKSLGPQIFFLQGLFILRLHERESVSRQYICQHVCTVAKRDNLDETEIGLPPFTKSCFSQLVQTKLVDRRSLEVCCPVKTQKCIYTQGENTLTS